MANEKTQGAATATEEAPGENTVQITFLPEGKTVQFEHGKLPYEDHGKEESLLDIALNFGSLSTTPAAGIAPAPPVTFGSRKALRIFPRWMMTRQTGWTWPPTCS
jgi:hypothetical protein